MFAPVIVSTLKHFATKPFSPLANITHQVCYEFQLMKCTGNSSGHCFSESPTLHWINIFNPPSQHPTPTGTDALDERVALAGSRGFVGCFSSVQYNHVAPLKAALLNRGSSLVTVRGNLVESNCGVSAVSTSNSLSGELSSHTSIPTTIPSVIGFRPPRTLQSRLSIKAVLMTLHQSFCHDFIGLNETCHKN